ncbi:helix-turn-helix transcriptional regulator [Sulfitobacter sp. M57]|uniref:ArsR/SmtB family transcription factor n=1 Tax=unclassified Sulfitobacter TaxID=196795 RepID=UPI0023E30CD1|nr:MULTISPECIES: winged helix-turn-helix domain-containing protein [unclassified Sulfitobacter]MDF3414529.1 helix-turn-helix transcriptional regulator [Sulfitobacter sp. KE5]MDF3422010.1 helix-turn-helix transcriptional regulator [Sulfitobacter sp. KE43]MDF3433075.1 helix-turn-helix transcriptional regulator [Sulfitobacter sp. KE42]MDF3458715.1 helix-turn-helix transcriptional regulator [Sulfitobacter sp. S74]MDF3462615.1 helix-turn-helix transcriptional regulator [Sulfitobacter sp. Ks18]
MKEGPDISRIAALIGDPARANILTALMSGKALTATELASEAGVTVQTTSAHLAKLEAAEMIACRKSGRHKYFTLGGDDVGHALEALMGLAAGAGHLRTRTGPKDEALREARVCYNHLAGAKGIALYQGLLGKGLVEERGTDVVLTAEGASFLTAFGVDVADLRKSKAPLCRSCLDWSARQTHLAGSVGRALLARMQEIGWAERVEGTRVVRFSRAGEKGFAEMFGG